MVMSYYMLQSASKRTKSVTGFALALIMVFQTIGPGIFALKTANAAAPHSPESDLVVCQQDSDGHYHPQTVNGTEWTNHHSNSDFVFGGTSENGDSWCGSHAPHSDEPCITPALVFPGDKVSTYGISPELSLQQILDTAYAPAGTINTVTNETGIQSWNIPIGQTSLTISGKFVKAISANPAEFGYYFDNNTTTFVPIFKDTATHTGAGATLSEGSSIPSLTINTTGHTSLSFAIDTQAGSAHQILALKSSLNPAGEDHGVVFKNPNNPKGYVMAFEDLTFDSPYSDKDYQDIVIELNVDSCSIGGDQCVPGSGSISSDTTTDVTDIDGTPQVSAHAILVTPTDVTTGNWVAPLSGVSWIWSEDPVTGFTIDKQVTFTKTFTITGTPTAGSLSFAADNTYEVIVNGTPIASNTNLDAANFNMIHTFDVKSALVNGVNTLVIKVINKGSVDYTQASNPAGLMYSLTWSSDCGNGGGGNHGTSTVHVEKFVDGKLATFTGKDAPAFPIKADLGGTQQYSGSLSSTNNYSWNSDGLTNFVNTVDIHELAQPEDANSPVVSSVESCTPGKYYLDGYTFSDSSFDTNHSNVTSEHPHAQGISHDKYVVIWNKSCPTAAHVTATKIVCNNESDLPNFGDGHGAAITASTAADWVASHASCSLKSGWNFQWAPSGTANPGDNSGSAGSPWNSTGATINDGTISFDVPVTNNGDYVWMREVTQSGYIPFTSWHSSGSNTPSDADKFSAEIYCGVDHLNFDNYDRIDNLVAGNNYNCVAWNVPTVPSGTLKIQKYECPANFVPNRNDNGVGKVAPEGCTPKSGTGFEYTFDASKAGDNSTSPFLGLFGDTTAFTALVPTDANGLSINGAMPSNGRYIVRETNSANLLGLYCTGDGEPNPNNNDNQEITFVPAGSSSVNCVAYNKVAATNGGGETQDAETIVVKAANLETTTDLGTATTNNSGKWFFYNDTNDTINNVLGSFVTGPLVAPLGTGSAQMTDPDATGRIDIATFAYSNILLSNIKSLGFSWYSHSGVAGPTEAPYLVFNVSFDGTGAYQNRLVYVPSTNGAATQDAWNTNDAISSGAALWVYSGATWPAPNALPGTTPKTWSQILTDYPLAKVLPVGGFMGVRVGEPGPANYQGNVDKFVIAIKTGTNTHTTTYDFEPTPAPTIVVDSCEGNCGNAGGNGGNGGGGGSSSGSRHSAISGRGGNVPQVLGATAEAPGLPNTGNGAGSQTLATILALALGFSLINFVGFKLASKNK